jgi:PPOX class probable F420-dependent enzyme
MGTVPIMSYRRMTRDECLDFLQTPIRPGVLATTCSDGRPHAVPVWYDLDGPDIVFTTFMDTVKGVNLRRGGQATLCVQDDQPPFAFVTLTGEVSWSDHLPEVRRWAGRIGGRYMGMDRADEYGERNAVPGELLVRLSPANVVGFLDLAD